MIITKAKHFVMGLSQDLFYARRMALKAPLVSLVVILGFAVGTGANSAIFSIVNAVLIRPLPYPDSTRLVQAREYNQKTGLVHDWVSYPNFADWRERNEVFENLAAYRFDLLTLSNRTLPQQIFSVKVSSSVFSLLKVAPAIGRTFTEEEDQPGHSGVVILSDQLWRSEWNADPAVIGTTLRLNEEPYTVVGIMPPSFEFPPALPLNATLPSKHVGLYLPLRVSPASVGRAENFLGVVGRLKPGVSLKQAEANMQQIAKNMSQQYADTNRDESVVLNPLLDEVVGKVRPELLVLQAATFLVLFILCGNVANVLLARLAARQKEVAIRLSLGATRAQLVRLVLTESFFYAICGSSLGFLLAISIIPIMVRVAGDRIPRLVGTSVDGHLWVFSTLVAMVVVVLSGVAPALHIARMDPVRVLKTEGERSASGKDSTRLRNILLGLEVGLATTVLVGTVLVVQTFANMRRVDLGFQPKNVLTAWMVLPSSKYPTPSSWTSFFERVMQKSQALPGVASVGAVSDLPLSGLRGGGYFDIAGTEISESDRSKRRAERRIVSRSYFRTMEIPVLSGRNFTDEDHNGSPCVAMVNQAAVDRYWPSGDAVGKRISFNQDAQKQPVWRSIIGVVKNVRHDAIESQPQPEIYVPFNQDECGLASPFLIILLRTLNDPRSLIPAVRRLVADEDRSQPVFVVRTMEEIYADALAEKRLNVILFSSFGTLALGLAILGVYGITAYSVRQRTREIGIRLALGADRSSMMRMILRRALVPGLIGMGGGLVAAIAANQILATMLYGVGSTDLVTYLVVSLMIFLVVLSAACIPALRATTVDPALVLRYS